MDGNKPLAFPVLYVQRRHYRRPRYSPPYLKFAGLVFIVLAIVYFITGGK
jgi:hypothetical protein